MASFGHVAVGLALGRLGAGMLSARGLYMVTVERLLFLPFWAYARWPRRAVRPVEG